MSDPESHLFAQELQSLMRLRGITQAELARLVPTSESVVSRWYRGLGRPSYGSVERLAAILNTDFDALWRLAAPSAKEGTSSPARQDGVPIDPAIRAEVEARTARFEHILAGVPRPMWAAYLEACEKLGEAFGKTYPQEERPLNKPDRDPVSGDAAKNADPPVTHPKGPRNRPVVGAVPALALH